MQAGNFRASRLIMATRLRVLISAYACEPGKGSEPEVGWQWARQMARFHDVTVVTRANNRPAIEAALEGWRGKQPLPAFVYHDLGPGLVRWKRRVRATKLYYVLWQRSARDVISDLHRSHAFDLMHHVTFAAGRYPAAIWGHGVPSVWGPIGGIESVPWGLLPWGHPASLVKEAIRNLHNRLQTMPFYTLPARGLASTVVLASTPEMKRAFKRFGLEAELMPTIGLDADSLTCRSPRAGKGPLKLLYVGNLISLKGIDLALRALSLLKTTATFTLYGSGDFESELKTLTRQLGLQDRVAFRGRLAREEILEVYSRHDVLMFPSLHDTGGYAVIEAMGSRLPVICLDCGGPAVAVQANCGIKVGLGSRANVIAGLAAAIRWYDENREAVTRHGENARQVVLRDYDWESKGRKMNACYERARARWRDQGEDSPDRAADSLMGLGTNLLHWVLARSSRH